MHSMMHVSSIGCLYPASILYKYIAGRYRPVSYPDGPITTRYRFVECVLGYTTHVACCGYAILRCIVTRDEIGYIS